MLTCRYLTLEEKRFCAAHSDLTFLAPSSPVPDDTQLASLPVAGCFYDEKLLVYYWLYWRNAASAYIAFGCIGKMTRKHLTLILHNLRYLQRRMTVFGEVSAANRQTLHLVQFLGGRVLYVFPGVNRHLVVFEPINQQEVQHG